MDYWKINRRIIIAGLLSILCLIGLSGCGVHPAIDTTSDNYTKTVKSADGVTVKIPDYPQRIVTLTSAYDTVLLGLIDTSRIAAISSLVKYEGYSMEWQKAKQVKTQLYSYPFEKIVKLKPDLVLAPEYTSKDVIDALRGMGIPTVVVNSGKTVESTIKNIETMAYLVESLKKGIITAVRLELRLIGYRIK